MMTTLLADYGCILRDSRNYKHVRIDDYVENDSNYVDASMKIINERILQNADLSKYFNDLKDIDACTLEITKCLNCNQCENLINLDKVAIELSSLYFNVRKQYDAVCDNDLNNMLLKRQNIIFETTGINKFDWLFENTQLCDSSVLNDYVVIMIYPYVSKEIILTRTLHRFLSGSLRLPPLITGEKCLINSIEVIQDNVARYVDLCNNGGNSKVNVIMLYDNMLKMPMLTMDLCCKASDLT